MAFQLISLFVWGNGIILSEKAIKITKIKQIRDCVTYLTIIQKRSKPNPLQFHVCTAMTLMLNEFESEESSVELYSTH